jgi:hypothetical protein
VLVDASFFAMRPALLGFCLPRCGFLGRLADDFPDDGLKELWSLKGGVDADGVALVDVPFLWVLGPLCGVSIRLQYYSWVVSGFALEGGK